MSQSPPPTTASVVNVPNQLSIARIVLAVVLFALLAFDWYLTSMTIFIVAGLTDFADGYWARKYGQVTQLGRILDPFADKIVVCGSFIFLVAEPDSLVTAWMAVVIVGRELLVTALRSFLEERGGDFSAKWSGKWKMALQCLAVVLCLWRLSYFPAGDGPDQQTPPDWLTTATLTSVWAAVGLTVYSGVEYIVAAIRMFRPESMANDETGNQKE